MKHFVYALTALALLLGLTFAPVAKTAAAATTTPTCGDTYKVQKGDYLTAIAKKCGTTLENILKLNPSIKNASLIYPNQVLRLTGAAPTTTPVPTTTATPASSGTYTVVRGDTLSKIAKAYGTTLTDMLKANPEVKNASLIYVGQKLRIPTTATSPAGMKVSLTATTAKVGDQITVSVTGFPKNASVDFRLGKDGQAYSVVADGTTDASGAASAKLTIPTAAKAGEKWVVVVLTTELAKTVSITSALITIQ